MVRSHIMSYTLTPVTSGDQGLDCVGGDVPGQLLPVAPGDVEHHDGLPPLLPEHVHLVSIAWPVLEPEPLVRQSVPDPATLL